MGQVRAAVEDDIPQIAELYDRVFSKGRKFSRPRIESYLADIVFRNPTRADALPSLAYADHEGKVVGFLGVIPRRMSFKGRPVQAAISHTFMVERGGRSSLAGVQLLKTFLSGPQDLSIADGANDYSRKIWEALGGTTELLYSIGWTRPLRPCRYLLSFYEREGLPAPLALLLKPICSLADALVARIPQSPFRRSAPRALGENLDDRTMLACLREIAGSRSLLPEYDARGLAWLFGMFQQKKTLGAFRKVLVRNPEEEIIGWYLYYANPGGVGEVVQIAAKDASVGEVLEHLFHDAWKQDVLALSGRIEPRFARELSLKRCLLNCDGRWPLVHSRNPALLEAIHYGDAFLTRLEGEWWIGLQEGE